MLSTLWKMRKPIISRRWVTLERRHYILGLLFHAARFLRLYSLATYLFYFTELTYEQAYQELRQQEWKLKIEGR